MMQLDTAEDAFEQSYAVRGGARGEEVVLGMGAGLMNSVRTVAEMRRKQDALDAARHSAQTAQDEE